MSSVARSCSLNPHHETAHIRNVLPHDPCRLQASKHLVKHKFKNPSTIFNRLHFKECTAAPERWEQNSQRARLQRKCVINTFFWTRPTRPSRRVLPPVYSQCCCWAHVCSVSHNLVTFRFSLIITSNFSLPALVKKCHQYESIVWL